MPHIWKCTAMVRFYILHIICVIFLHWFQTHERSLKAFSSEGHEDCEANGQWNKSLDGMTVGVNLKYSRVPVCARPLRKTLTVLADLITSRRNDGDSYPLKLLEIGNHWHQHQLHKDSSVSETVNIQTLQQQVRI
jgi:hypothetical protein